MSSQAVRKRKNKGKKKEVEVEHSTDNFEEPFKKEVSTSREDLSNVKSFEKDEITSSGVCAKLTFVFLISLFAVLAGLIYIQLHSDGTEMYIPETLSGHSLSGDDSSYSARKDSHNGNSNVKHSLDVREIEEQIIVEVENNEPLVREVDVEVPQYDPDNTEPVDEPLIVKETAHVLGPKESEADASAIKREDNFDKDGESNKVKDINVIDDSDNKKNGGNDAKTREKKRSKAKRNSKPKLTEEEIQQQINLIERGEHLMEAILKLSPNDEMVSELRPHLDDARRDLKNGKIKSTDDTTIKHVLLILEDLYVRLDDQVKSQSTLDTPNDVPVNAVDDTSEGDADETSLDDDQSIQKKMDTEETPSKGDIEVTKSDDIIASNVGNNGQDLTQPDTSTQSPSASDKSEGVKETAPQELVAGEGDVTVEQLTEEDLGPDPDGKMKAAEQLINDMPHDALNIFNDVLSIDSLSARAALGRARCLDVLAQQLKSNQKLDDAISSYKTVLSVAETYPNKVSRRMVRATGNILVNKMRFRGRLSSCVKVQRRLVSLFPDDPSLLNQLGISHLLLGQVQSAEEVFTSVVQRWPHDGVALVHLGFILKTTKNELSKGAALLREGISSGQEGTADSRFYFHLGDALQRMGDTKEALKVYEEAARIGLFPSAHQRSLYNVDRLTGRPVWSVRQTTYEDFLLILEQNWKTIRSEGKALLAQGFTPEAEGLKDTGTWGQLELFSRGKRNAKNCALAPITCALVGNFPPAGGCKRGQTKFSVMEGGTHVWPHCGPTNCRLRAHLGLVVPSDNPPVLRVANSTLNWKEGQVLVFDDSFEHEVWHNGTQQRLVLIVDLWHPELTAKERDELAPI